MAEDRRIERKPGSYSGSDLGEYIGMWANTRDDGGLIVVGQCDKRGDGFEGCSSLSDKQLNQLEKTGFTFCPDAKCKSKRVQVNNRKGQQDFVVLFRVHYHPHIVVKTVSGKVFIQIGDSKIELKSPEEIRELQSEKGELSFEESRNSNLISHNDFDQDAISAYVREVRKARKLGDSQTTESVLELRHLGRFVGTGFVPNYACTLLFSKDPLRVIDGCKIRFQRFEGEHEAYWGRVQRCQGQILEGTVPQLIQQIEAILDSQLQNISPLDEKGKFFPVQEYPKEAWYEAVVNACVHRSYGNGMKNMVIFVKMFDDRLVVESPGPFPPFVTPQNIYEQHHPRNPKMMDAMFYMDYVKCEREGKASRDSMHNMKLPEPIFRQDEVIGCSTVRVTLRNNIKQRRTWIDHDVSRLVSEAIAAALTEQERRALNWAADNGSITISDANKLLETSWQSARRLLIGLARKRIFQYIRFKPHKKDVRDPKAFFRLRSTNPIPEGSFEQTDLDAEDE